MNDKLHTLFAKIGSLVKCKIQYDKIGRSEGTAIVEYSSGKEATEAIDEFNKMEIDGHELLVEQYDSEKHGKLGGVGQVRRRNNFDDKNWGGRGRGNHSRSNYQRQPGNWR